MSDKTLENLMTENTNMDDNTTLTEELPTEDVTTEEPVVEESHTEEVATEPVVEEVSAPVEEEVTEDVVTTEEAVTEETVSDEAVETEPVVEEAPALVEEQVVMEEVLEEVTVEEVKIETAEEEPTMQETVAPVEGQVTIEEIVPTEEATPVEEEVTEEVAPTEETITEEVVATETTVEETPAVAEETVAPVPTEEATQEVATTEVAPKKEPFKLTPPENNEELFEKMCVKRGRKLIYAPKEVIYDASFTVLGTNKKNEEGIRIKDILEAEIKEGTRLGYLDKYDGLKSSEIKEEYENDIIYEYAEQEFKKMGIIFDGKKIKVYVYDWDGKACHHVGFIDETAAADSIKYFSDKENYSFDLCGIITGGKGKRVTKNDNGKLTITKEKGGDYGIELDISVIARKD